MQDFALINRFMGSGEAGLVRWVARLRAAGLRTVLAEGILLLAFLVTSSVLVKP